MFVHFVIGLFILLKNALVLSMAESENPLGEGAWEIICGRKYQHTLMELWGNFLYISKNLGSLNNNNVKIFKYLKQIKIYLFIFPKHSDVFLDYIETYRRLINQADFQNLNYNPF